MDDKLGGANFTMAVKLSLRMFSVIRVVYLVFLIEAVSLVGRSIDSLLKVVWADCCPRSPRFC
jgi:hypothetical protein